MKTTITETRSILYVTALSHPFHTRHFGWAFYLGRQQLHKTLHAIKSTLSRLCLDSHTLGRNSQAITFLSHLHRRRDLDGDVRLLCPHVHLITSRGIQLIGKILGNSLSLSSDIGNSHLLWQDKLTWQSLCLHWHRDNIDVGSDCRCWHTAQHRSQREQRQYLSDFLHFNI